MFPSVIRDVMHRWEILIRSSDISHYSSHTLDTSNDHYLLCVVHFVKIVLIKIADSMKPPNIVPRPGLYPDQLEPLQLQRRGTHGCHHITHTHVHTQEQSLILPHMIFICRVKGAASTVAYSHMTQNIHAKEQRITTQTLSQHTEWNHTRQTHTHTH